MCDLSNSSVKNTAKDIQQTEQLVNIYIYMFMIATNCLLCLPCYLLSIFKAVRFKENISGDILAITLFKPQ
jgi:hypothetical protein